MVVDPVVAGGAPLVGTLDGDCDCESSPAPGLGRNEEDEECENEQILILGKEIDKRY